MTLAVKRTKILHCLEYKEETKMSGIVMTTNICFTFGIHHRWRRKLKAVLDGCEIGSGDYTNLL